MISTKNYKWTLHWSIFGILISLFVLVALFFENKNWIGNVLQTIGTVTGIYLTIIIFLLSKEDSDKQSREHLNELQKLNNIQIEALQSSTEKQINTLQDLNAKQIDALKNSTDKQITALHELIGKQIEAVQSSTTKHITSLQNLTGQQIEALKTSTEKQIEAFKEISAKDNESLRVSTEQQVDALHKATYAEISSFEKKITEVTEKLTDNSFLLAEILGRELEKSIAFYDSSVKTEEARYNDLSKWKFLRTPQEKQQQLNGQWDKIEQIRNGLNYLIQKYNQVKSFLGFGKKKLQG
jgi:hypothetical protein